MSKEWRLLRPGLVAAIGLAILPMMFQVNRVQVDHEGRAYLGMLLALCMFIGGVLLSIETFGREFHQQTSTLWLALPMSRAGLWRSKVNMVGLAVLGVVLLNWMLLLASAPLRGFLPNLSEVLRPPIAMLGGTALGLFWSVRLRQTWAALWMSLITPGALMLLIQLLAVLLWPAPETNLVADPPDVGGMFTFGFCVVGFMAFFLARQGFNHLEDLGPVGEDVQLKAPRFLHSLLRVGARPERPTRSANSALWWKEIRLQQVNFALAVGFALILLFLHFLRYAALSASERFSPRDLEFVDILWALWSLLPLTIGLATMAEERRLGVDSWQETLPMSRARRWWIKIGAAYGLAFGVGVVVPVTGEMLTRSASLGSMLLFHGLAWLIMTTAGIYVSSLARNLVHAISILVPFAVALGFALSGGLWVVDTLEPQPGNSYAAIPSGLHFTVVTGLLFFLAALWLAWRNSAPGRGPGFALRLNLLSLATAWVAGVLLVSGTRARAWEWLRPEPASMSALPDRPEVQPNVIAAQTRVAVLTAAGNLWLYGTDQSLFVFHDQAEATQAAKRRLGENHRWLCIGASENRICAVRSDGTLWQWGESREEDPDRPGRVRGSGLNWIDPTQVGVDADWQQVSTAWGHAVALKRDGTLWGWGNNSNGQLGQPETDFVPAPTRIGGATNWTQVTAGPGNTLASNSDGEIWEWGWVGQPPRAAGENNQRLWVPTRVASGMNWKTLVTTASENLGLTAQGEVWILRQWSWVLPGKQQFPVRWQGSPARDAILGGGFAWSIDDQGSLLRWTADRRVLYQAYPVPIVETSRQVGSRTDWVALSGTFGGHTSFGLTADGGLWTWGMDFDRQNLWLPPSQRPRQVALLRAN